MALLDSVIQSLPALGGVILTSAVVSAFVAFAQNLWLEHRRTRDSERARLRQSFAEAFAVYSDYIEFPYAIRRRRFDQPDEERARLANQLQAIQSKLSYYRVWTLFESPEVGAAYAKLLEAMRREAGKAMQEAWIASSCKSDGEMNISGELIDLRALRSHEDHFVAAVEKRLNELAPYGVKRK